MALGMSRATAQLQSAEHHTAQVRQALEPLSDAQAARRMRACMRDQLPFLGSSAPLRREAVASLERPAPVQDPCLTQRTYFAGQRAFSPPDGESGKSAERNMRSTLVQAK